jgi:hypothetical protein
MIEQDLEPTRVVVPVPVVAAAEAVYTMVQCGSTAPKVLNGAVNTTAISAAVV